jgi:pilus biogenesis lipoprotein CpaD
MFRTEDNKGFGPLMRACRLSALALIGIAFSGCAPGSADLDPALGWQPASSLKSLEVEKADLRHSIYFATDKDELVGAERDRLIAFLKAARPKLDESIRIEGHADERASDLYNLDLAARRIETVKHFLVENGIGQSSIFASSFGERVPSATGSDEQAWRQNRRVEIVLERYVITPPACPDWSRRSGVDFANGPHSNFGCATAANLGLMIANPRDLVEGRRLGHADGVHQADGVVRYREGQQPELEEERVN